MIFVPQRNRERRAKDVLAIMLRNLWPGEELLCTSETGNKIRDRVELFCQSRKDMRIIILHSGPIRKIRRVS